MLNTTVGQFLLNEQLPKEVRDYHRTYDKKSIRALMENLTPLSNDVYRDTNDRLHRLASELVTTYGKQTSISLDSFKTPDEVKVIRDEIAGKVKDILDTKMPAEERRNKIIQTVTSYIDKVTKTNYDVGMKNGNAFALQVSSGARGNPNQFRSINAGDLMFVDHKDRPIPIPVLRSYSEGLDPVQYWAGAYGARKGAISTKFATPEAGYLGKQMVLSSHKLMVTEPDCSTNNGYKVKANEAANEGALLLTPIGKYPRNTILTPKILKDLGDKDITVRSPLTCQAHGGICQKCAGIRERGTLPPIGDNIGIAAAQAISEPIGQGQLSVKHGGGLAGGKSIKSGLDLITQLVSVPETFQGGASIATTDGNVDRITDAPQGGKYVIINGKDHWVDTDYPIKVKPGDTVEAGDVLSDGIVNPAAITKYKGIGEGRKYFVDILNKALEEGGFGAHRRNIELLSRGMINHVRINSLDAPGDTLPDDVIEYDPMAKNYTPRAGSLDVHPKSALNHYLEQPVLHYSIGTRITPRVAKNLQESNIDNIKVHKEPPPFEPEMVRAMENLAHSDDWMVRMGGLYGVKRSFIKSLHRTSESQNHSTSYIPALAQGVDFGKKPEEY